MICPNCGTKLDDQHKFCPQCGITATKGGESIVPAVFSASALGQNHSANRGKIIGGVALIATILLVIALVVGNSGSSEKGSTPNSPSGSQVPTSSNTPTKALSEPPKPQAPPLSGLILHPYDLLKNPYQAKEKLVLLDLNSRPVLYDGAVIQYSGPVNPTIGARFGLMALRLDRMADENVALYNIMGIEAGASYGDTLGQLAVALPDGTTELRLDRNWMVEPLGPLKGTNYVGADIQIPAVRFWRYVGNGDESTELTVPPQSHETPGEPVDWQPDGPPPPPGPDAQRLSILGLKGGITKQQAFNLLANAGFTADGCEDKGNGYQWCTNVKDGTREVKAVFFRDELEHIVYTFPDSEYTALRKSYLDLFGPPNGLPNNGTLVWGSMAGGAVLTLGERVDRTGAFVMLAFQGGLADQYMKHLAQSAAQSAR
ncbi:MAG TPA: zinc-ribbon domain-containing protein [Terracidiphilus sp.]|jgi:hypothetical protein|nr:zinc-ribbon domain-containing protein [Terracidiphilus sp.]